MDGRRGIVIRIGGVVVERLLVFDRPHALVEMMVASEDDIEALRDNHRLETRQKVIAYA